MKAQDTQKRIEEAYKLLTQDTTSREKFESIRILINGINPKLDRLLGECSHVFSDYEKIQHGEIIELTAEHLPQATSEEKRRKKALLYLIKLWNEMKSEVERVRSEFENMQQSDQGEASSIAKIVTYAKGPLGVITLAAVVIVAGVIFLSSSSQKGGADRKSEVLPKTATSTRTKVIIVNDKKIPVSETVVAEGPECDRDEHYHARDHISAKALDGSIVPDPGRCGFGKVKDVKVLEVE